MNTELIQQGGGMHELAQVGTMQQTRTQYSTAMSVQRPRELSRVESRFLQEASLAGETFFYGWGQGKDRVEGASVDLAMSLVRTWGNCAVEMQPVQETADAWIFTAAFVDLETGFTLSRQFRQSKNWTVYGKFDADRKDDIRFQIGQSKAIRNVVLNALPKWLAEKAIDAAKENVRMLIEKGIEKKGMDEVQRISVERLTSLGVDVNLILLKFGRSTIKALTIEDLIVMRADFSALEKGQDTIENLYSAPSPEDTTQENPKSKSRAEAAKSKMAASKKQDAKPAEEPAVEADSRPPVKDFQYFDKAIRAAKSKSDLDVLVQNMQGAELAEHHMEELANLYDQRLATLEKDSGGMFPSEDE